MRRDIGLGTADLNVVQRMPTVVEALDPLRTCPELNAWITTYVKRTTT